MKVSGLHRFLLVVFLTVTGSLWSRAHSVARQWNDELLKAVRLSFPDPPVHARNLFHVSVAMYDAWAAYDPEAVGYIHREEATAEDVEAARNEAVSYAAFRVLLHRYTTAKHPETSNISSLRTASAFNGKMRDLGYDVTVTGTEGDSPAAVGNRVAESILSWTANDHSNESGGYADPGYEAVNVPLDLEKPGTIMADPNRWQPLEFIIAFSQTGQPLDLTIQEFVGAHWREVWPFALSHDQDSELYLDPGPPPMLADPEGSRDFQSGNVEVIRYSSLLDPDQAAEINISPGAIGNNSLGSNDGSGHVENPVTGEPYAPNMVNEADFGRVVAEYWADGPNSETPPGHWNVIANEVVDHPLFERRWMGSGPELDELEWDVKMYFLLNAAVHDAAVAAWTCKREYDYVRPISSIRYLAQLGQSSNPEKPSYHVDGLPLVENLIEVVTEESAAPGGHHSHLGIDAIGKIALRCWQGEPIFPEFQVGGVGWILAENWFPYQRATFVTPAFAGYVSGHSTFSRAAAEVLTRLTGSAFFPGGLREHTVHELEFEAGPEAPVTLQWATFYDAADQAGISRLYGGIHVPADDGPGRIMGSACGKQAWDLGLRYFDGSILTDEPLAGLKLESGAWEIRWKQRRGLFYKLQRGVPGEGFEDVAPFARAEDEEEMVAFPFTGQPREFFRVQQSSAGE